MAYHFKLIEPEVFVELSVKLFLNRGLYNGHNEEQEEQKEQIVQVWMKVSQKP